MEDLRDLMNTKNEFMRHNNIHVEDADMEHSVIVTDITPISLNPYGIVHGGLYFTMMDVAAGMLARMDGRQYVTLDSSNHFHRGASHGRLTAVGKLVRRGRTICVVNTEVHDEEGHLVADGSYSMFCLGSDPLAGVNLAK